MFPLVFTVTTLVSDPTTNDSPVGVDFYHVGTPPGNQAFGLKQTVQGNQYGAFGLLYPAQVGNMTGVSSRRPFLTLMFSAKQYNHNHFFSHSDLSVAYSVAKKSPAPSAPIPVSTSIRTMSFLTLGGVVHVDS